MFQGAGRSATWPSIGWGLLLFFGLPILAIIALVTVLGGLVWFAAVVLGLGALMVAIWRARSPGRTVPAVA